VSGNGVNGQLLVAEDSIELNVRLGFALKLMEGPIRSAIEAMIDEELA
jgi:putative polyhydroxyalkanoate system protein